MRRASILAFHSTGSFSTFAWICAGDSSTAPGPVLLFSSPGGAHGRRTFSRYAPSAIVTPPIRTLAHSSSVFGLCSTVPLLSTMTAIASKTLSAIGSSMSRISSLTETTGFISPHSCGVTTNPDEDAAPDEVGAGEHAAATKTALSRPAAANLVRRPDILNSLETLVKRRLSKCNEDAERKSLKNS